MRRTLLVAVLLLASAGCSAESQTSGDEDIGPAGGTGLPVSAALPACSAVFVPGKVIDFDADAAAAGCLDPDGGIQVVGSQRCGDGGRLYTVKAATGAPAGWGRHGGPFHAAKGDVAADPDFGKAYDACNA